MNSSRIVECVNTYSSNGLNCLPIAVDGTKRPAMAWAVLQDRKLSEAEIEQYWGNDKPCGIGILAGASSQNLHVIDFDSEAKNNYAEFVKRLDSVQPGLSKRLTVIDTPRPGIQVWFRQQSPVPGNTVLARSEARPTGELDADGKRVLRSKVLIETRGQGGYAVAVGGPDGVHPSGQPYTLRQGGLNNLQILTDQEVSDLLTVCRELDRCKLEESANILEGALGAPYEGEPRPGDIYNERADFLGLLQKHGWQVHHTVGGSVGQSQTVNYLTRPGKDTQAGYSATLGHVTSNKGEPLLVVHSTADLILPDDCYDAFHTFANLEHNGDLSAAASEARKMYRPDVMAAQRSYTEKTKADAYIPFPVDLLPKPVREYVEVVAEQKGLDPAMLAMPALSCLAAMIGGSRVADLGAGFKVPCILWLATIAKASAGKSPAMRDMIRPARELNRQASKARKQAQERAAKFREEFGNAGAEMNLAKKAVDPATKRHFLVDDATLESLLDAHQYSNDIYFAVDELKAWLDGMGQYKKSSNDVSTWLQLAGGEPVSTLRMSREVSLDRTCVNVYGGIQPAVAEKSLFTEAMLLNGFAHRFIFCRPPANAMEDRDIDGEALEAAYKRYERLCFALRELRGTEREDGGFKAVSVETTPEARRMHRAYQNGLAAEVNALRDDQEELGARLSKMMIADVKFALIFSMCDQVQLWSKDMVAAGNLCEPIDADCMCRGIELARWFTSEMNRVRGIQIDGAKAGRSKEILDYVRLRYPDGITPRQLQQARKGLKTAASCQKALQELADSNQGEFDGKTFYPC